MVGVLAVGSMKIEWRQLLIVAVVAVVFGGSAGYLGGHYSKGTGDTQIVAPRYSSTPPQYQSFGSSQDRYENEQKRREEKALDKRLKCIEDKARNPSNPSRASFPC